MAVSELDKVASEMYRTLKPGSTAFATLWETFGCLCVVNTVQRVVSRRHRSFVAQLQRRWIEAIFSD
jgi:hypothetical protein